MQAQIPTLLKDINTQTDIASTFLGATLGSDSRFLVVHNGVLFFTAKENGITTSLWKSLGKSSNTLKITDFPGVIYGLTSVGNLLYFVADEPNFGLELWKSDGTAAGTKRVKDIQFGSVGSMPESLTNINGTLYFVATTLANGSELWKSDGTEAGTVLVKDIVSGSIGSYPQGLLNINEVLYFVANDGANGYELWKTNGTAATTQLLKDINPGQANSSPQSLTNVNGALYFVANNGINGHELWKSDGTANGTVMVKDIWVGSPNAMPHFLTNLNGTLYFAANEGLMGNELWKSDGTSGGTSMVKEIQMGSAGGEPRFLKTIKNQLYFSATNGQTGYELWKSDGTETGTVLAKNIRSGGGESNSNPLMMNEMKSQIYFTATDGIHGREWWKSNGTESEIGLIYDLKPQQEGSVIDNAVTLDDTLFFTADDGKSGTEIWRIESCLPIKQTTNDTTICHKGTFSLPRMITNYSNFINQTWRKGSFEGIVVTNPTAVTLDSTVTDYYLTAQLQSGCTSTAKITVRVAPMSNNVGSLRAFLEGPYRGSTATMTTKLNEQGLLPGQTPKSAFGVKTPILQPYAGFPWYYGGNETTNNYATNITDWVLVSLRTNADNPTTTVFKAASGLQNDGYVYDIKGCPAYLKDNTRYYLVVEHRNHVGIVSSEPTLYLNGGFYYDFTTTQSYIPANRPGIGQKKIGNSYVMYAGDAQKSISSAEINANDIGLWLRENGIFGRYLMSDINMDSEVNAFDRILWGTNNGLFSGVKF